MNPRGGVLEAPTGWWRALNPAIYLISVLPGLVVLLHADGEARISVAAGTFAVVLLQHAINVLNDVADWRLGADVEKGDSWVRAHHGDLRIATAHGVLSLLAGGLIGLGTLAWTARFDIIPYALPLVALGYLYNAGTRPLSYTHLGEWVTGICYGGVFHCLWLLAGLHPGTASWAGTVSFGALAVALLLSHQPPQIDTDRAAGKRSFAVRYGAAQTCRTSQLLFVVALAALGTNLWATLGFTGMALFVAAAIVAGVNVVLRPPNPRRILLQAVLVVGIVAAVRAVAGV